MMNYFPKQPSDASYFMKIIWCFRRFCNPHRLRKGFALFVVAKGWLLLGWLVLILVFPLDLTLKGFFKYRKELLLRWIHHFNLNRISSIAIWTKLMTVVTIVSFIKRKRKRYYSVLWQKPLHQQKYQKGKVTSERTPQKSSITQRLRTDLGQIPYQS